MRQGCSQDERSLRGIAFTLRTFRPARNRRTCRPQNPNPLHFLNFSAAGFNLGALRVLFAGVVERDETGLMRLQLKGDTVPLEAGNWYDFHEFGWQLGNVGSNHLTTDSCLS